jgi:CBS domain-containing protein
MTASVPSSPVKGKQRVYAAEERTRALICLASLAGNVAEARRSLSEAGVDVPAETLRNWKRTDEYERIRHEYGQRLEDYVVAEIRERMVEQSDLERLALQKTREALENDDVRDPARTMRDIAHAKAQNIDKLRVMTGRPTDISENRSLTELVKALEALGIAKVESGPVVEGELVSGE